LGQPRIKSAEPFVICEPPTGPFVLSVTANPREYLHFERDPLVSFVVDEDGGVLAVKIEKTSGSPELDAKAVSLIEETKYHQRGDCVAKWSVRTTVFVDF
jgi:TonB family protein